MQRWIAALGFAINVSLFCLREGTSADFAHVPGTVLLHGPSSGLVASPSIAVMPDGAYFAKAEWNGKTWVFRSDDRGRTWKKLRSAAERDDDVMKWGNLFIHRGDLYLLGTRVPRGDIIIRKYDRKNDEWSIVEDDRGRLVHPDRDEYPSDNGYHTAPVSIVVHNGRIWRAYERFEAGGWGGFNVLAMSAPVDADLLDPQSWTFTNEIKRNFDWHHGQFFSWLEGNAVVDRDGQVVDILRVDLRNPDGSKPCGKAAIVKIENERRVSFDPDRDFIEFPGGQKKFTILFDPVSDRYWSITNFMPQQFRSSRMNAERFRGMASLISSPDLREWRVEQVAATDPRLLSADPKIARSGIIAGKGGLFETISGFQYVDFEFDGEDLVYVSRTAYDDKMGGPKDCHDSNFCTFHRITDFRNPPPHVLLADAGNNRVLRFEATAQGPWFALHEFAKGVYAGQRLRRPVGLMQAKDGFIYIVEGISAGRLLKFDAAGDFLSVVGKESIDFEGVPDTLARDNDGGLWLITTKNNERRYYALSVEDGVQLLSAAKFSAKKGNPKQLTVRGELCRIEPAKNIVVKQGVGNDQEIVVAEGLSQPSAMILVSKPLERRWMTRGPGEWDDYYNWHAYWGTPNTRDEIAVFADTISKSCEISVPRDVTAGGIRIACEHGLKFTGDGQITLAAEGPARLEVCQGSHTIDTDIELATDCEVYIAEGASLSLDGEIRRNGHALRVFGPGFFDGGSRSGASSRAAK